MRIISILFIFFVFGSVQIQAQNSGFTTVNSSQCPGNLYTLSADDNSLVSYSWTITEQGGGSSIYNVNPIAFVLTNPGLYDVSLTVSDGVSFSNTTEIGFLEVFHIPTIDYSVTTAPYCEPATVDFINNSTPGSGTIIGYQLFTDGTAYFTEDVQHIYASAGTYSVNVSIENSNGCSSSDDLADIVVSTNPVLTSPLNPNTICSGSAFNYTPTSSIVGSVFSWVRLSNPDISEAVSSGNGNISETLTNTSGSNTSVTYQVTNTSPTGCAVIENVIVTVQALPSVTINSLNVCTGSTGVLTATPSVGGGNYLWSTSEVTQSITVSTAGVYSVAYSVGSCASAPASVTVTETAPPALTGISNSETSGLANDDGTICKLDNVTLTALPSTGLGIYEWSNGSGASSITVSPGSTTTYSVTYEEGGCVSAPLSQTIIVYNLPGTNYDATVTNGCISPPFNPDISTDYTTTASGTISWQFPGGTPNTGSGNGPISVTYNAEGIYDATITVVSAQGCSRSSIFNNTIAIVNGLAPTSSFALTNGSPQCLEGNTFCFEFTGFNADTIEWDFGDGSPTIFSDEDSVVCHTFGSIDTFTVSMIPYTTIGTVPGCSGSGSDMEVITLGPQAAFNVSPLDCEDQLNRTFTSTSIGTTATTQYTWGLGDPPSPPVTGVTSTTHTFSAYSPSNSAPYVVTLTVEDPSTGCPPSSATQDVYAFPNDQAEFGIYLTSNFLTPSNEVCLNEVLWFLNETPLPQNTSPSLNSIQTQWDWDISNGYQWQSGSEFRGSQEDLDFNEVSSVTSGNISWVPGVYDIAMRNTANNDGTLCYDTVVHSVTVHGIIGDLTSVDTVCIDELFVITDNSSAPLSSIVQRDWDWENDGIIDLTGNDPNPSHSFSAPGEYVISLTCTDAFGCMTVVTETVIVREVIASFNVDRTFICDDEEVTITANNSSSYGPLTYTWSAATNVTPNTSTASLPGTFLFNDEGNNTITLSVIDNLGCADNTTTDIEVFDVVADGSGNPNIATCFNPPTVVTFTNSSSNNVDPNSIFWDFGNGETSTENSPTTIYTTAGSFPVSLTVESLTGGCTSTVVVETIEVAGPFGAIAVTSPVLDDCSCLSVDIDVTTSDVAEATLLFGDGSFQNVSLNASETINHQYCNAGTTSQTFTPILYIASGTCNGNITANESVTIQPLPTVDNPGDYDYCEGEASDAVLFTGNIGSTTYNWTSTNTNTGINASGTGDIPSFITTNLQAASDEVSVITVTPVIDATGCVGVPQDFSITVKKSPVVNAGTDGQVCEIDDFTLNGSFGVGASSAQWSGGLGIYNPDNQNMSAVYTPTGAEIAAGSVVFTLTTDDPIGVCSAATDVMVLTINTGVIVDAVTDQLLCEGGLTDDVIFTGPNPTTSFIWTNDNTSIGLAANGSGDILAFTADNTNLIDQDATITVTPEFNGCLGNSQTFLITVKPKPNAFATPVTQEYCSGQNSDEIFFTGDLAGTQYDWSNDNVSTSLSASGIGDIPSFTVINSSSTIQTSTISVMPSFNGCDGDEITATIVVNPISTVVVSSGIDEYCHNDPTLDYIFDGSSGTSTYNWVNDNTSIGLPATGTGDILSFTATNTDLVNQIATITVEPVLNGCVGVTQIFQILVKPIPTVDAVPNQNICANDDTDAILFEGTMNDTTAFGWTHDNVSIGLSSNGTGDIPSFVASNISQDIQEGNITVTPILNGCIGTAETVTITVNPISIVNAVSDTVCAGEIVPQIDFTGNNSSSVYTWVNDNNSIGLGQTGNGFIPVFDAENLGTTTQDATIVITPSVNGCPGINDTIHIVVYPTPIVDPIGDLEYCPEQSSSLITFTGNMAMNQYDWINDNAAIGLVGSGVGDINSYTTTNTGTTDLIGLVTVTPTANGCVGATEDFSIIVHPLPNVDAGLDTTLCFNQSITLTATGAISYAWDNGVINGVEFSPNSTITYNVIGTDANLCQNTDDVTITYLLDIPPVVDAGPDQAICLTDDVTLTAGGDAILYQWNNGVIDGVPFAPIATDTYLVIVTAANGCLEADTVEVVVNPLPVITANASDDFICDGESTILWGEGTNTYIWDQGVLDSVSFVPAATATYTVIGYDYNGCADTTDIEVIVNPLPNVLFSTDMTFGGCIPFSPTFTDLTESPESNEVLWVFGNGASSTQMGSVINTYDSYGCYNVTLISTTAEGCTDSLTQDDFVCVNPVMASFYLDVYEQSVINPIFEFTNESVNSTSFEWFFGDGTESDFVNTTHFYDSYGVYNVALVAMAEDGCTDTAYVAITVNDEVLFYVPNSFTPNGDGKNEVFIPVLTAGYDRSQGYEFSVYNRWGEQIFFSETPGEGWDGTYNSAPAQNGTYIWYVKFKDSMNNLIYNHSGHFNLIK